MSNKIKNQRRILDKLGIEALNEMQQEAQFAIHSQSEVIVLSPTGTGKTLAFLLPIISELKSDLKAVQALIIAPSRELAVQIGQVTRDMGTGHKINLVYGGRSFSKDKTNLKHPPTILIGTPGRVADHLRRHTFETTHIRTLVLDEFDKSLEIGFEEEMKEIVEALPNAEKKIMTSATQGVEIPNFMKLTNPLTVNYLADKITALDVQVVLSPDKDKLTTLSELLVRLQPQAGIVFCNFKASIQRISQYLDQQNIAHAQFYGGMEQRERELALLKFRNGTHQLLLSTDLAARGIDVPEIKFIVHYHLPLQAEGFTHRNGRTARMLRDGTAYVLHWKKESLPDFIAAENPTTLRVTDVPDYVAEPTTEWATLQLSVGRRDNISKGDVAGFFFKQGNLNKEELGKIELQQEASFVAVAKNKVREILKQLDDEKIKKKKVRIRPV